MERDEDKAEIAAEPDEARDSDSSRSPSPSAASGPDGSLQQLAEAVADGERPGWPDEAALAPDARGAAESLRAIAEISHLCRRLDDSASPSASSSTGATHPTWGEYVLHEKLGEGSFAEVYEATDPILQRPVALKLFKPGARPAGHGVESFLDEARRLAQVRHPNVIVVHGADVHGGRAGLCTELLQGDTLEEVLVARGRFGAEEAALIGAELCSALAALHAAGFVHGDVKASNVMRAEGGRIVLMDFGSSAAASTGSFSTVEGTEVSQPARTGTPLALPPEVLRGGPPTEAADVYQLGVLLYRLVTGIYPHAARTLDELKSMHERQQRRRLRDLRPDLPAAFVQAVERALESEPQRRFSSMGEMEAALRFVLAANRERRQRPARRRWVAVAAVVLVLAGAALVLASWPRFFSAPLQVRTELYRLQDGSARPLDPQASAHLRPGEALFMTLQSRDDLHVYVLNEATAEPGVLNTLFPDPGLRLQNPLPGGVRHRLPSDSDEEAFWEATAAGGVEKILVVASREAYDAMEAVVAWNASGEMAGPPGLDPARLEALGLRAIELRKQTPTTESRIDRMTQLLEAERRAGRDIWFEVIRLESASEEP